MRLGRETRLSGSHPCGGCSICPFMVPTSTFVNPATWDSVPLHNYINCKTKIVIYGLVCSCPKLYVGQTSQLLTLRVEIWGREINWHLWQNTSWCIRVSALTLGLSAWIKSNGPSEEGILPPCYYEQRPDGSTSYSLWRHRALTRNFYTPFFWMLDYWLCSVVNVCPLKWIAVLGAVYSIYYVFSLTYLYSFFAVSFYFSPRSFPSSLSLLSFSFFFLLSKYIVHYYIISLNVLLIY